MAPLQGLTQKLFAALVSDTTRARRRGTAFGIFNPVGGVAMLIASVLAGWLWSHRQPSMPARRSRCLRSEPSRCRPGREALRDAA
jgi:MFS family permease